jgi:hypothetical protein
MDHSSESPEGKMDILPKGAAEETVEFGDVADDAEDFVVSDDVEDLAGVRGVAAPGCGDASTDVEPVD